MQSLGVVRISVSYKATKLRVSLFFVLQYPGPDISPLYLTFESGHTFESGQV